MPDKDKLETAMNALNWIVSQRKPDGDPVDGRPLLDRAQQAVDIIEGRNRLRHRMPRPMGKEKWPPDMDQEAIEQAIDKLCGCGGKWDCDCVSVFNQVGVNEWTRFNTRAK